MTRFRQLLDTNTPVEMAALAEVESTTSVRRWDRDNVIPRYEILKRIAKKKGWTVDELMAEIPKNGKK